MTPDTPSKGTTTRTATKSRKRWSRGGWRDQLYRGNNSFDIAAESLSEDLDRHPRRAGRRAQNPTSPTVARERAVQIAEFKQEQDQILRQGQQLLREAMFARHPYHLNILGKPETVAKLTRADLVDFHRRFVVPNNMVLTVFGNVKADDVRQKIEARFGGMNSVKLEFPRSGPGTLAADARKVEIVPKQQAVLLIGYSGVDMFSKDRFAMELLNEAYSGLGSRVFQRIRDALGLCYYVGLQFFQLGEDFLFALAHVLRRGPDVKHEVAGLSPTN